MVEKELEREVSSAPWARQDEPSVGGVAGAEECEPGTAHHGRLAGAQGGHDEVERLLEEAGMCPRGDRDVEGPRHAGGGRVDLGRRPHHGPAGGAGESRRVIRNDLGASWVGSLCGGVEGLDGGSGRVAVHGLQHLALGIVLEGLRFSLVPKHGHAGGGARRRRGEGRGQGPDVGQAEARERRCGGHDVRGLPLRYRRLGTNGGQWRGERGGGEAGWRSKTLGWLAIINTHRSPGP